MQLLSAKTVKEGQNKRDEESRARSAKIRQEESKANLALSQARAKADKEIADLEASVSALRAKTKLEKAALLREVKSLEERKRQALKPIQDIQNKAEAALKEAQAREAEAAIAKEATARERETLMQQAEWVKDRQDELDERELAVAKREAAIGGEEKRLKESEKALADRWLDFHVATSTANSNLATREAAIKSQHAADMAFRETLDETARKQRDERRALNDGFEELAKARKEILGRDT